MSVRILRALRTDGDQERVQLPAFDADGSVVVDKCTADPRDDPSITPRLARRIDRAVAAALVLSDGLIASLPADFDRERVGVFFANSYGGWTFGEPQLANLVQSGASALSQYQATAWFPAAAQGEITIRHQLRGCSKTVAGTSNGGALAAMLAADAIDNGDLDFALVGASEAVITPFVATALARNHRSTEVSADRCVMLALGRSRLDMPELRFTFTRDDRGAAAGSEAGDGLGCASLDSLVEAWRACRRTGRLVSCAFRAGRDTRLKVLVVPAPSPAVAPRATEVRL